MMRFRVMLLGLILAGCAASNGEMQATAPPPTLERTAEVTPDPPSLEPTFAPTETGTPTVIPTPTFAPPTLSGAGPWLILDGYSTRTGETGLFLLDAATNEVRLITPVDSLMWSRVLVFSDQPTHQQSVMFAQDRDNAAWLMKLSLRDGQNMPIAKLLDYEDDHPYSDPLWRALNGGFTARWHGDQLAFVSALEGSTTNVYLYDEGEVCRISDETELFISSLDWSPDGAYVVYGVREGFGIGGFPGHLEVRAIDMQSGAITTLSDSAEAGTQLIGWLDDHIAVMVGKSLATYDWATIYQIDLTTGERKTWWDGEFVNARFDPISGTALLTLGGNQWYAQSEPEHNQPAGVILASADRALPVDVKVYDHVTWLAARGVFLLQSDTDLIAITPSGAVSALPAPDGFAGYNLSPDGQWILWTNRNSGAPLEEALIAAWGQEPRHIADELLLIATWMPNTARVYFMARNGLIYAEPPTFEPVVVDSQFFGVPFGWIEP